jgi:hypothetical protein
MRNELVRWTKPPRLVTAELVARKDSVGLADLLWVYEAPLAAAALVPPWWLFMLWMSGPFTMHGTAVTMFVLTSFAILLLGLTSIVLAVTPHHEPLDTDRKDKAPLSYRGRKKLCQYEQNRKRAITRAQRRAHYPECDHQYSQFSVWTEPMSNGVQLVIIEHVPRATGPIPRRYEVRVAAARGRIAKEWLEEPEYDDLTRRFSELELIAEKLENDSYEKVVTEKENHRNALMVRR